MNPKTILATIESVGASLGVLGSGLATLSVAADYADEVSLVGGVTALIGSALLIGVARFKTASG